MEIVEKQYLSVESLLSYKARTTYGKLDKLICHVNESLPMLGLKRVGSTLFTISEHKYGCDEPILDVEIMIPINIAFKSNEYYVYKPRIVLTNALKKRCSYNFTDIFEARTEMQQYIYMNERKPLTEFFYRIIESGNMEAVDIYIGINENIV